MFETNGTIDYKGPYWNYTDRTRAAGYWIVRLKNNETMNFEWGCHYVDCTNPNVAVFSTSPIGYKDENTKACKEPLAMIPYHMIEYIKFIKED